MTNNVDVKELLLKAEGLLSGHFCLTSGLHSDTYFQCAKLYQYPDIVETLASELAKKLENIEFDTIVAHGRRNRRLIGRKGLQNLIEHQQHLIHIQRNLRQLLPAGKLKFHGSPPCLFSYLIISR